MHREKHHQGKKSRDHRDAPYVSRIVISGDKVVNKTFINMKKALGYECGTDLCEKGNGG